MKMQLSFCRRPAWTQQYQNGIDFHLDWGASQFVSKHVRIGLAGYFFQQLTGDSGPGATLDDLRGRELGVVRRRSTARPPTNSSPVSSAHRP
jgi:hypothetical protein